MSATVLAAAAMVVAVSAWPAGAQTAEAPPGAVSVAAPAGSAAGFIHGTVRTRGGTVYRGLLRWGTEEAFWGDLFNSTKVENVYAREVPRRDRRRSVTVFGLRVMTRDERDIERQFVARFGDIEAIEVAGSDEAVVRMKGGQRVEVEGGANDVEATIEVHDEAVGVIEVPWRKIDVIEFSSAPASVRPYAERLYGVVESDAGRFEGFIQWDSQECLSTDKLDGDSEDGRLSIEMGRIRSIERRGRDAARVALADGRELVLDGTNDVDHSIRGIFVEDRRFGRVKVSWDSFDRLDLREPPIDSPSYGSFAGGGPLRGSVAVADGRTLRGRLVFDLDEAEQWEILHGSDDDVEYLIPFAEVASVVPRGARGSLVTLNGGGELRLEDSKDVGEDNAGVLVYERDGERPTYVPWDDVRRIDLDR